MLAVHSDPLGQPRLDAQQQGLPDAEQLHAQGGHVTSQLFGDPGDPQAFGVSFLDDLPVRLGQLAEAVVQRGLDLVAGRRSVRVVGLAGQKHHTVGERLGRLAFLAPPDADEIADRPPEPEDRLALEFLSPGQPVERREERLVEDVLAVGRAEGQEADVGPEARVVLVDQVLESGAKGRDARLLTQTIGPPEPPVPSVPSVLSVLSPLPLYCREGEKRFRKGQSVVECGALCEAAEAERWSRLTPGDFRGEQGCGTRFCARRSGSGFL